MTATDGIGGEDSGRAPFFAWWWCEDQDFEALRLRLPEVLRWLSLGLTIRLTSQLWLILKALLAILIQQSRHSTHNGPHRVLSQIVSTAQLATSPASQQTCKLVVVELKMLTLQLKQQILRKHKSCSIVLQTCGSGRHSRKCYDLFLLNHWVNLPSDTL